MSHVYKPKLISKQAFLLKKTHLYYVVIKSYIKTVKMEDIEGQIQVKANIRTQLQPQDPKSNSGKVVWLL